MNQPQTQREYWSGKVGDDWASNAERIDAMLRPVTAAALEAAALRAGERVLDIGCGAGATTLEIARRVGAAGAVVGVDLSPQLLDVARGRAREAKLHVEFVEADAGDVRFGAPFDVAFSRFGVMFFETPARAFAHIRANMKPGGRLAFACWRPLAENRWTTIPLEAIAPMLKAPPPPPDPEAPGPYALADAAKTERVLSDAGWRDIALSRWDGPIDPSAGGGPDSAADFLLRIGPCARAIGEQQLDAAEARRRLIDRLTALHAEQGLAMAAACWLVTARA